MSDEFSKIDRIREGLIDKFMGKEVCRELIEEISEYIESEVLKDDPLHVEIDKHDPKKVVVQIPDNAGFDVNAWLDSLFQSRQISK